MNRIGKGTTIMMLALVLMATGLTLAQQRSGEVALREATETELTRGASAAIEQYGKVAETYKKTDPATAAKALLRMAEALDKQGDSRSRTVYDQIIQEFPGQANIVASARARLEDSAKRSTGPALRKVFDGDFLVDVSLDDRYLIYQHGLMQDAVVLRDLSTGSERTLDEGGVLRSSRFSPDGTKVAYTKWVPGSGLGCEIRVMTTQPVLSQTPRSIYRCNVGSVTPIDWSPDGQLLAVRIYDKGYVQLGLLRVSDGKLDVLESIGWEDDIEGVFSPDGQDFVVGLPKDDGSGTRDIFMMNILEKRQTALVTSSGDDFPLGWTPNREYLLFSSTRNTGSPGVWAQRVENRKAVGTPKFIQGKPGGGVRWARVTRSGSLYYGLRTITQDVEIVPIDFEAGKQTGPPVQIRSAAEGTYLPAWSSDGNRLAYVLLRNGTENTIGIHTVGTGDERELALGSALPRVRTLAWTPDGRSLVGWGQDSRGRYGIFQIDAGTGNVTPVVFSGSPPVGSFFWPDGRTMFYLHQGTLYEHTESSEVFRGRPWGSLSPDLRWVARLKAGSGSGRILEINLFPGGAIQELAHVENAEGPQWIADGSTVMVVADDGANKRNLLLVPIDGTAPRTLDLDLSRLAGNFPWPVLSPDGRHAAYVIGEDRHEVWAMDNFLSVLK